MLERLLAEIRLGGPLTTTILASRLNTSVEMVNALLERLVQFGFIRKIEPGCSDENCHGCSIGNISKNNPTTENRIWTLS